MLTSVFVERLREVRKLYRMADVLGLPDRRTKIVCPLPQHVHASNTPSFHIFNEARGVETFQCFGSCGLRGDVIDLVGYMYVPGYDQHRPKDVQRAVNLLDRKYQWREPEPCIQSPGLAPNMWKQYLPPGPEAIEYARQRGLTSETLAKFRVGQYKHWLAIPVFQESVLMGIKFRNIWPKEKLSEKDFEHLRFWSARGSRKALFNHDAVAYTERPLLFLKGEIPVMLMDQHGFLACGLSTGESTLIEQWKPVLAFSRKIVVVGDNDPDPGVREKTRAKAEYRANAVGAELVFPPAKYKDIDEYVLAEKEEAIRQIRSWLEL